MRKRAGIVFRIGRNLGEGLVSCRLHELLELPVRHRSAVDPEAVDRNPMRRRLLGIVMVRSHAECTAWDPDHVGGAIERGFNPPDLLAQHRVSPAPRLYWQ